MNRSDFYYRQIVTEQEMDQAFDDVENAIDQQILDQTDDDHAMWGVYNGLLVAEQSVPDLTVQVSDGIAYDENGKRLVHSGGPTSLNLASYVPAGGGESVYVRVYAERDTVESDPRIDGNAVALNYRIADSILFSLAAGTAGGSPTRPAIVADKVLLATVLLTNGQTQIQDSDISMALGLGYSGGTAIDIDRHEGGSFAHGRGNARVLAFVDPVTTRGDRILLGNNNLNTERGNILLASDSETDQGGKIYMQEGSIRRANQIFAADPHTTGQGHLYHDESVGDKEGTQLTLEKWYSYHASQFFPSDNNGTDPWDFVGTIPINVWWLDGYSSGITGGSKAISVPAWRVKASAPAGPYPRYTWPLFLPLTGLPHGGRLELVEIFIRCPSTQHGADESLYTEIWKTAHDLGTLLASDNVQINTSGYHREGPVISGGEIIDNFNYQYCCVCWIEHDSNVGDKDVQYIFGGRAKVSIREASGVY